MSQEDTTQDDKQKLPELAKEKLARVRQHLKDNRKIYLVGAGCLTAGYLLRATTSPAVIQTFANSNDSIGTVINRSKNIDVVIQYLNQRGYIANPVRCLETGIEWPSQAEAAAAIGATATNFSAHMTGKLPHINNFHFERVVKEIA